ncbi:MAG: UbiD family decarboxylase [Planctomycetota bacterium]
MFRSLGESIAALEHAGELRRIDASVSPVLEVARIADLVSKSRAPVAPSTSARANDPRFHGFGGQALLFERVEGSDFPLLINAYGSYSRCERLLGCGEGGRYDSQGFDAIGDVIGELVKPQLPQSLSEAISKAKQFLPLLKIGPKRRKGRGPSQEVVRTGGDIDLTRLPIIRCWPHDGDFASLGYPDGINDEIPGLGQGDQWERLCRGRYITLAGIHTIHADDARSAKPSSHNIGMYRVQLLGQDRCAMHWHIHHDGASHWRSWKKRGEPMPVAIALGGESVLPYAATAPLPPGISELLMAGFLNGGGIELVRGATVPLWVPANAEIIIEGFVRHDAGPIGWDPRETDEPLGEGAVFEGPFGDHTGFYSMPDRYPIVEVTAVTHRRDAVYPTTIVGLPPQEDYYLGKATERVFFPLLKTLIHDIEDYDLPMFGAFHNCASVRIDKAYPLQARRVMHAIWGAGQMAWTKTIFVVDGAVDVHDAHAVLRAAASHCQPDRDLERVTGPLDILDHAAPRLGSGTKLGFDCTPKWPGEDVNGPQPALAEARRFGSARERAGTVERVLAIDGVTSARWPETLGGWLFVGVTKDRGGDGSRMLREVVSVLDASDTPPAFVIAVDPDADLEDIDRALFLWCANSDTGRDALVHGAGARSTLLVDATSKTAEDATERHPVRAWPPILRADKETAALVERRWREYGFEGEAPSLG